MPLVGPEVTKVFKSNKFDGELPAALHNKAALDTTAEGSPSMVIVTCTGSLSQVPSVAVTQ